jgi:hypothetical protein
VTIDGSVELRSHRKTESVDLERYPAARNLVVVDFSERRMLHGREALDTLALRSILEDDGTF